MCGHSALARLIPAEPRVDQPRVQVVKGEES